MRTPLLDRIAQPDDLKKLSNQQVIQLCSEIRGFLIEAVAHTGGHLASNLGMVELTVALHRVLKTPQDKIVFDVGHQCYTHKLLTGRKAGFAGLRQLDGISGFPNPRESEHDAFIAGHDANIDLDLILNTRMFDFEKVATSAGWIRGIEGSVEEEEHHHHHEHEDEHEHHHDHHDHECGHHHHHHDEGEAEEYGISTFVYYRRRAFDLTRFDSFVARHWPSSVIRAKGVCYFTEDRNMSYLFEQAGRQKTIKEAGLWYATAPEEELAELMRREPGLMRDWDPEYGDRMQKIVFIGQHMDKEEIVRLLDECLE